MERASKPVLRFVRALLAGGVAERDRESFVLGQAGQRLLLPATVVRALVADGVIAGDARTCACNAATAQWLKRQLLDPDAFAAQHRTDIPAADGARLNLAESPLARLATAGANGEAFLRPHQVEAGERVRRLVERAHLQPRVTMSYSPAHTAGEKGSARAADVGDMAAEARKSLAKLYGQLPRDCAEVVLDVCGFAKGLQQVEAERGWPRRSAKLVLRIGLDHVAALHGLSETAAGAEMRRRRAWMDGARVAMFG